MSFWSRGKKKRFSLERLKELLANLQKNPIVTDRNKGVLVETLRELAELLVWGDQNDERLFDFFLEKNVFAVLLRVMEQKDTQVHVQLLQSLSILLENIAAPSALYYLLSCDRVNAVITHHFDFSDEELMAYYVSFLKTLSLKLDASTVQFYFNDETQEFPLYTEAVKFFNHGEGMVRVAVRTITLAVFKVAEPRVRAFVTSGRSAPYFGNLVWFIQSKSEELQGLVRQLQAGPASPQAAHRFRDCVDELSDLLYYIQDIYALNVPELSVAMSSNLLDKLAQFVEALSLSAAAVPPPLQPAIALYVLGQLFFVMREPPLLQALAALLLSERSPLLALLSAPGCATPAVFLLLCLARSSAAPTLLGASLARQSSLLQAILAPDAAAATAAAPAPAPPAPEQDGAIMAGLLGVLSLPVPLWALQCTALLLRALLGAAPLAADSPAASGYAAAAAQLRTQLVASPGAALASFERGLVSYRQLNVARLAQEAARLLLPPPRDPDETVHRFLVLRDLLTGQRETLLPLQPASVPLAAPGARVSVSTGGGGGGVLLWREAGPGRRVLAVHATHLCVLDAGAVGAEEEEAPEGAAGLPPSLTAPALLSLALQHAEVLFAQPDGSFSHSLPTPLLRLSELPEPPSEGPQAPAPGPPGPKAVAAGDAGCVTLGLGSAEAAAEAQAAVLSRRNGIVDSKLRQLAVLLDDRQPK